MNPTPVVWQHVRIVESKGTFAVVSYYVRSRFGPLALVALGMDAATKTEGISRAEALALGEKLEKKLVQLNGGKMEKRRGC